MLYFLEMLAIEHDYGSWRFWVDHIASWNNLQNELAELSTLYDAGTLRSQLATSRPKIARLVSALDRAKRDWRFPLADTMDQGLFYPMG